MTAAHSHSADTITAAGGGGGGGGGGGAFLSDRGVRRPPAASRPPGDTLIMIIGTWGRREVETVWCSAGAEPARPVAVAAAQLRHPCPPVSDSVPAPARGPRRPAPPRPATAHRAHWRLAVCITLPIMPSARHQQNKYITQHYQIEYGTRIASYAKLWGNYTHTRLTTLEINTNHNWNHWNAFLLNIHPTRVVDKNCGGGARACARSVRF